MAGLLGMTTAPQEGAERDILRRPLALMSGLQTSNLEGSDRLDAHVTDWPLVGPALPPPLPAGSSPPAVARVRILLRSPGQRLGRPRRTGIWTAV